MNITAFDPRWIAKTVMGVRACHEFIIARPPDACGIRIDCPICIGEHRISIYTADAPADWCPGVARLDVTGDDIRTVSVHPSIRVVEGCKAHVTITNGEVRAA